MKNTTREDAERTMRNFSSNQSFQTTVNKEVFEYIMENYATDCIFCYGKLRRLEAEPLTGNYFRLKTVPT